MRLPIKRERAAQILNITDFSGGLNLRDGISEILDNQLTDCKNMWWKDGVLKTRPGIDTDANDFFDMLRYEDSPPAKIRTFSNITFHITDQEYQMKKYCLQAASVLLGSQKYVYFYGVNKEKMIRLGTLFLTSKTDFWVCMHKNMLYCFTSQYREPNYVHKIYKYDLTDLEKGWQEADNDIYVPKVLIQCKKIKGANATKDQVLSSGVMIEGFNILSDYYQMSFNSYNPEIVTEEKPAHEMRYHIVESIANAKYAGKTVTAEYNGVIHTVTLTGEKTASVESKLNTDKLQMRVWKNSVSFWDAVGDGGKIATVSDGDEDDLIITAPYISSEEEKEKVYGMSRCEWFGGGTAGLKGGTRLFLCGNQNEPALVLWSDINNPLYFPDNSYFYVGDNTSRVTGFGKQSDMLIIFKESETWCTTYRQNTDITAQNLINQSVVDLTSSSVFFPLAQINSNIGCPYPDTVQLCRNRLVWLGKGNKVYTLVDANLYNERDIFCVSEMVDRKLSNLEMSSVTSCDWNGYYCLCFGEEILLMDYNCYGFMHIASYSKTEDANIKIPWYCWDFPINAAIATIDNEMILSYYFEAAGYGYENCGIAFGNLIDKLAPLDKIHFGRNNEAGTEIVEKPVLSAFTTKIFDFGIPHIRKNVEQINLQLGNNGGKEIKVRFITENGSEETEVYLDGTETESHTAGYIDSRAVFPCIKQVLRFGIKIECTGNLAIDGAIIKCRITGGAR